MFVRKVQPVEAVRWVEGGWAPVHEILMLLHSHRGRGSATVVQHWTEPNKNPIAHIELKFVGADGQRHEIKMYPNECLFYENDNFGIMSVERFNELFEPKEDSP